jgi:flagellar protein FliO/FliZ
MLELADLSRTVMGLGIVLALMVVVFWLLRRFGPPGRGGASGARRRLALVESLPLDPRTRLVLVRQDDREHLLVVSASGSAALVQTSGRQAAAAPLGDPS